MPQTVPVSARHYRTALFLLLASSALLQAWALSRAVISPDQIIQLPIGMEFARHNHLLPVAQAMSGGGMKPGSLYQLLLGLPLKVWYDYRAPRVLMGLFALMACVLFGRTLAEAKGHRFACTYLALYGFSPWLILYLGSSVDIAFLFLPAALHFWACWRLRDRVAALPSFVLASVLLLSAQIHGSFPISLLLTVFLLLRKRIAVDARWIAAGLLVGALPLLPTFVAALNHTLPQITPRHGFVGLGLVYVYPVLKGIAHWLLLSSPDLGRGLRDTIYLDHGWFSASLAHRLTALLVLAVSVLSIATVVISLLANIWYVRNRPAQDSAPVDDWLWDYVRWGFVAMVISCMLSPVVIQGWHLLPAFPIACLPVAVWIDRIAWTSKGWLRAATAAAVLLRLPVIGILLFGHPTFNRQIPVPASLLEIIPREMHVPVQSDSPRAGPGAAAPTPSRGPTIE